MSEECPLPRGFHQIDRCLTDIEEAFFHIGRELECIRKQVDCLGNGCLEPLEDLFLHYDSIEGIVYFIRNFVGFLGIFDHYDAIFSEKNDGSQELSVPKAVCVIGANEMRGLQSILLHMLVLHKGFSIRDELESVIFQMDEYRELCRKKLGILSNDICSRLDFVLMQTCKGVRDNMLEVMKSVGDGRTNGILESLDGKCVRSNWNIRTDLKDYLVPFLGSIFGTMLEALLDQPDFLEQELGLYQNSFEEDEDAFVTRVVDRLAEIYLHLLSEGYLGMEEEGLSADEFRSLFLHMQDLQGSQHEDERGQGPLPPLDEHPFDWDAIEKELRED
ncbi:MAG: hypothetical protein Q8O95_06030 [bacterium]|nr:hypothetical protein [bacterium]